MNVQVHSIFCDDIRHEIGGKVSLIGVYSTNLLVQTFPALLPKLCCVITVIVPIEITPRKITFRVLKGEEKIFEENIETSEDAVDIPKHKWGKARIFTSHLTFSPIAFDETTALRVRVSIDGDEEVPGMGLLIDSLQS